MARIAALGEVMVELAPANTDSTPQSIYSLGYAGDTFNTAVYLARAGANVDYVTLLGDDPFSDNIITLAQQEQIGTQLIGQLPGRVPGLYAIRNTANGEREFFYWRGEAPARQLFSPSGHTTRMQRALLDYDFIYLSGITLAIINEQSRSTLFEFIEHYRSIGGTLCFDSNYRPRLWPNQETAQTVITRALQHTDIALLTLDDERLLWQEGSLEDAIKRYSRSPITELIFKRGARDVIAKLPNDQFQIAVPTVTEVVDTTGAGDSFNAGYLAARLQGLEVTDAIQQGIKVASIVIRHPGGVVNKQAFEHAWASPSC